MLSILIPIYNYNVTHLVTELHRQAEEAGIVYEICLLDDGSSDPSCALNRQLAKKTNIRYQELPQNVGRAAIRNRLAQMAKYEYLLFMDCDSSVVMPQYLQIYLRELQPDLLLYGGRTYLHKPPNDPDLWLHWHYGRQREQQDFQERQRNPYHAFMTNNFLIPRAVFAPIQFEETLLTYGHEDTLFGMELAKRKLRILHLNNPLLHLGLETRVVFLEKTKLAVWNLVKLQQNGYVLDTKLSNMYTKFQRWKLAGVLHVALKILQPFLWKYLLWAKRPQLFWLDLYKLCLFSKQITIMPSL
jgi:glycosyltransferase involved in cell wall biosynthesis